MQLLEAVLRRVAGTGESSQTAGGRMRRRRGEASSSVPPLDEDSGTSQMTRSGRSSRRTRRSRTRTRRRTSRSRWRRTRSRTRRRTSSSRSRTRRRRRRPLVRRTMTREGWQETYLPSGCEAPLVSRTDLYRSSNGRLFGRTVKGITLAYFITFRTYIFQFQFYTNIFCRNFVIVVPSVHKRIPNGILGLVCKDHYPGCVEIDGRLQPASAWEHYIQAIDRPDREGRCFASKA